MKTHIIEWDLSLSCGTSVNEKTMIASYDSLPTCKKCKKILKKEIKNRLKRKQAENDV